ncbi:hypothetical protein DFH09DRAFT_1095971 [Mycena vulgaris]|nr:hypothetical protein DFH09DRAFT_1095971 [Mycena vulgaris]
MELQDLNDRLLQETSSCATNSRETWPASTRRTMQKPSRRPLLRQNDVHDPESNASLNASRYSHPLLWVIYAFAGPGEFSSWTPSAAPSTKGLYTTSRHSAKCFNTGACRLHAAETSRHNRSLGGGLNAVLPTPEKVRKGPALQVLVMAWLLDDTAPIGALVPADVTGYVCLADHKIQLATALGEVRGGGGKNGMDSFALGHTPVYRGGQTYSGPPEGGGVEGGSTGVRMMGLMGLITRRRHGILRKQR